MIDINVPDLTFDTVHNTSVLNPAGLRFRSQLPLVFLPQFLIQRKLISVSDHWGSLGYYTWGESAEFSAWTYGSVYRITPIDQRNWFVINEKLEKYNNDTLWQIRCDYNNNGTNYIDFVIQVDLGFNFDGISGLVTSVLPKHPHGGNGGCGAPPGHICP